MVIFLKDLRWVLICLNKWLTILILCRWSRRKQQDDGSKCEGSWNRIQRSSHLVFVGNLSATIIDVSQMSFDKLLTVAYDCVNKQTFAPTLWNPPKFKTMQSITHNTHTAPTLLYKTLNLHCTTLYSATYRIQRQFVGLATRIGGNW